MKQGNRRSQPSFTDTRVNEYLSALKDSPNFATQIVHHEIIKKKNPTYLQTKTPLPEKLISALRSLGIKNLYSHQSKAVELARHRNNIIVSTPTASGKSLIYNIPVFEQILHNYNSHALYLFPLKALAQDQLKSAEDLAAFINTPLQPKAAVYDGDTSAYKRKKLRENPPHILITNPDMLHLSILAYHSSWAHFFAQLKFIVIDEVHTYRGVFGTHMAWVLRRLLRICRLYGSDPCFILSSATIGNPDELALKLIGRKVNVISKTGAPAGSRHFVFINPLESPAHTACLLLEAAMKRGLRTIIYTQSRKIAELVSMWSKSRLGELAQALSTYRAGYLPEERRQIEKQLVEGDLLGVVSTSALELGIDIGDLDICILVGYPGTIMSTWQRGGRVGRKLRDSLVVLIGQEDSLDQYFMRNPTDFFIRQVEDAVLNPANKSIAKKHLICAVSEHPLNVKDPMLKGFAVKKSVEDLADSADLLLTADGSYWTGTRKYPHREVNLRGGGQSFVIYKHGTDQVIGEIDGNRCIKECHPGAIYLHRGKTWLVKDLDLEGHAVSAVRKDTHYFTRPIGEKHTEILKTYESTQLFNFRASFGYLRVTEKVTGYQKRLTRGHKLLSTHKLDLPPIIIETEGLWLEIPPNIQHKIESEKFHFMGGIHALEHVAIGIFPLLVMCDRNDVGGIAHPFHPQISGPAVFIYDGYTGGVGLCRKAFEKIEKLMRISLETINSCTCELGCPSCVHSPKCGSGNRPIDKESAKRILEGMLIDVIQDDAVWHPSPHPVISTQKNIKNFNPARFGVFDVETQRSASEVGGWHRAERMGISVAVLYDSGDDKYHVFLENEIPSLIDHLQQLELVIGFNNKRFDNKVLSAYTGFNLSLLPTLDILEEIKNRLGYRLSLDRLVEHTLGVKKSATGLDALKWWKEGRIYDITTYCRKDVEITRDLYLYGIKNRYLLFCNKAGKVVRLPVDFSRVRNS